MLLQFAFSVQAFLKALWACGQDIPFLHYWSLSLGVFRIFPLMNAWELTIEALQLILYRKQELLFILLI